MDTAIKTIFKNILKKLMYRNLIFSLSKATECKKYKSITQHKQFKIISLYTYFEPRDFH